MPLIPPLPSAGIGGRGFVYHVPVVNSTLPVAIEVHAKHHPATIDAPTLEVVRAANHWALAMGPVVSAGSGMVVEDLGPCTPAERAMTRQLHRHILADWSAIPEWASMRYLHSDCESPKGLLDLVTYRRAVAAERAAMAALLTSNSLLWAVPEPPKAWSRA